MPDLLCGPKARVLERDQPTLPPFGASGAEAAPSFNCNIPLLAANLFAIAAMFFLARVLSGTQLHRELQE